MVDHEPEAREELPAPELRRKRPSIVWLIPFVAALIGAWMAVKAYREKGPTVVISFQSAEGLEADQTRVKYKDVVIGKVKAIQFSQDLSQVLVKAELTKEASSLVSENSRFWVVRAQVSTSGITGLGTLLSGVYIDMDPGKPGAPCENFTGLETPPILTPHLPTELIQLRAEKLGSLNIGSPVHYRQLKVGEVVGFDLEKGGQSLLIEILVHAPYNDLVRANTRFWDAGGADLVADSSGIRMHSDSVLDLLMGGIAFETPKGLDASAPPQQGEVFTLYPSHDQIYEQVYLDHHYFVADFDESVRGLSRGAPVEYRGIRVGQVEDFKLEFRPGQPEGHIPVLLALEPERLPMAGSKGASMEELMRKAVAHGLRAQLRTGSLLTGSLFVDLDFHPKAPARAMGRYNDYPEIPVLPSSMGALVENLTKFAERLQKLPLEDVVQELRMTLPALRESLEEAKTLMAHIDQKTAPQAEATLAQAQATLGELEKTLASDSPTQQDLRRALDEFTKASRSLKELADTLERHPESLLFGKGKAHD